MCMDSLYSNAKKAKYYAEDALKISKAINYKIGQASSLNRIGVVYDVIGNYDSAIYYYNLSYKLSSSIKYKKGEGSALCNLGLAYLNKSDYQNAIQSFYAAISPLSEIKNYHYIGNCYNNLGLLFLEFRNYSKALTNFNQAYTYYTKANINYEKASVLCNIGSVYREKYQLDSSIAIYLKALPTFIESKDYYNMGKVYNNLAIQYATLGKNELAESNFKDAIKYATLSENYRGLFNSYVRYSRFLHSLNKKELSNKMLLNAFQIKDKVHSDKELSEFYFYYSQYLIEQNRNIEGLDYLKKYKELRDTTYSVELKDKIAQTEAMFGVALKEKENEKLHQESISKDLIIKNKNLILIIFSIIGFIILASLIIYYRKRHLLQKLEEEKHIEQAERQQRLKISHDLHDNVGAQLSFIVSNLDIIQKDISDNIRIESVTQMGRQAIVTLRETVWALNNETITVESFMDKFKLYSLKMTEVNESVKIELKNNIFQNYNLQPLQALNAFRICQEAFNNALFHSKASNITIHFKNDEKHLLQFEVIDNGIGFSVAESNKNGHYGLSNMKARAAELGADITIDTYYKSGTKITLSILKV